VKTLALILALAALQEGSFTKQDILKLSKAGIGEEIILTKIEQEKRSLAIKPADLEELRKAGVSEKVLARLAELVGAAPKTEPKTETPAVKPSSKPVVLRNVSHRAVKVAVNETDRMIDFSTRLGTELPQGGTLETAAGPGEYWISIEGWPTTEKVRVPETGSCLLTVRGADTEYIDLQTIVAEDEDGRRVVILHTQGKLTPGQQQARMAASEPAPFCGPDWSWYPYVMDSVLGGVGVSAVVGYHDGDWSFGAMWGLGAGMVIGCGFWH
jgi:hypothetical protein